MPSESLFSRAFAEFAESKLPSKVHYSEKIIEHSKSLGHVPIIDRGAKSSEEKKDKTKESLARKNLNWKPAEMVRYESRNTVERDL